MKKKLRYLIPMLFIGVNTNAQGDYDWQVLGSTGVGQFTSSSQTYSLSYYKGGERVYVSTRGGKVDILNPNNGSYVKDIIPGTGFQNTKIRVTESGEIYSVTMRTAVSSSSDGQSIAVNYLANENSAIIPLSLPYPSGMSSMPRMGDSFDVAGYGDQAVLFIGGSTTNVVYIYKRNISNGVDFVRSIDMGTASADMSISIVPDEADLSKSSFFVSSNTGGIAKKFFKYNSNTGSYDSYILPAIIYDGTSNTAFSQIKYFSINETGFLAVTGGSLAVGKNIRVYKILGNEYDKNTNYSLVKTLNGGNYTFSATSNSGFSDVSLSKNIVKASDFSGGKYTLNLYQLVTNNAISKYSLTFNLDGTLPVSLSDFTASIKNGKNTLVWKTQSESNNDKFEVQRSGDGQNFEIIGSIASKAESGNSNSVLNYQFIDESPLNGINYYRLKQVDKNGEFKLYDVKFIKSGLSKVYVYPNPTADLVNIDNVLRSEINYLVYNSMGKLLLSGTSSEAMISISLKDYPTGVYFLKVTGSEADVKSHKIVKR
ncbi:hypothetical protein Pedsa_1864 [Pseudopedobacter saltans DSM 12145]|uniref:Secretion system C-terminal sorting domain-containing protein n=1 Tax=Pseudopedobacter saltans (strain ATCC 51119 / DSM 12145 / JCM 21818 / CCUG 39354 / LMG 10337 / NBRC 100064 / NCIMB 13643) TaxID=762903 RepID=F0S8T7_PSESL|nr:T9SS type A sorting domain-containing protein [Pseudopedobacter saltans]ADY52418.1 hypothetical protein Pedsa_1864 [Pseudopedobacter saltans DSM 12145]